MGIECYRGSLLTKVHCRRRHGHDVVSVACVVVVVVVDRSIGSRLSIGRVKKWKEVAVLPARRLHTMYIRNQYNDRSYILLISCVVSRPPRSERCSSSSSGFPAIFS